MSDNRGNLEIIVERQYILDEQNIPKELNFKIIKSELCCDEPFLFLIASTAIKEFLNELIFEVEMPEENAKNFLKMLIDSFTPEKV